MRFSSTVSELRAAVGVARAANAASSDLVAFSGVLLLVKGGRLNVIGSDGDTAIASSLDVADTVDGEALVAPRPLAGFLSEVPEGAALTASFDGVDLRLDVAGLAAPYTFRTIQARFPRPPASRAEPTPAVFTGLPEAVSAIRDAVDPDHGGVLSVSTGSTLSLYATDQYQLHAATINGAGFGEFNGVVPLNVWERVARHEITGVVCDAAGRTIRFSGPDLLVSTRLLAVAVPDMSNVLAAHPPSQVEVNSTTLLASLSRLTKVTSKAPVSLSVVDEVMTLSSSNTDFGAGSETVPVSGTIEAQVLLDPHRLQRAVAAHGSESVTMAFGSSQEPVFVMSAGAAQVTTVVSPLRA